MALPQINTDTRGLDDITFKINGCAMDVLNSIGHGFNEKIYENALAVAFEKEGLQFSQQKQFNVFFEDQNVGVFIPDFVVEDQIIVELKTIECIGRYEKGQVLNYLRASKLVLGIILNFKNPKLEWQRVIL
jgi:GxxExxY protein